MEPGDPVGTTPAGAPPRVVPAAPRSAPGKAPKDSSQPSPDSGDRGPDEIDHSNGTRIGSYAAFGVGVVGLGVGTAFVLRSTSKRKDADTAYQACGSPCLYSDPSGAEGASLDDEARSAKTVATVGFVVGGVGVAAGVTLLLLSTQHGDGRADAPTVHPWLGAGVGGVVGRF